MITDTQLQNEEDDAVDNGYHVDEELYEPYRSLSKMALFSLLSAVVALLGLLFPALLLAAVLALVLGVAALQNLRRYPDELTGKTVAILGVLCGGLLSAGGSVLHAYIYVTEVPEGYTRISFADLQPQQDGNTPFGMPDLPVELDNKRVFVKGYVHPGVSNLGEIRKFILVPDMGTCCFGGQPKLSDMIEVTITAERGIRYARRKKEAGGDLSHLISGERSRWRDQRRLLFARCRLRQMIRQIALRIHAPKKRPSVIARTGPQGIAHRGVCGDDCGAW